MEKKDIELYNKSWKDIVNNKFKIIKLTIDPPIENDISIIGESITNENNTIIHLTRKNHIIPIFNLNNITMNTVNLCGKPFNGIFIKQSDDSTRFKSYQFISYDDKHKLICLMENIDSYYAPIYIFNGKPSMDCEFTVEQKNPRNPLESPEDGDLVLTDNLSRKFFKKCKAVSCIGDLYIEIDNMLNDTVDFRYSDKLIKLYNDLAYKRKFYDK